MNINFLPKVMGIALLAIVGCSHGSDGMSENIADTTRTINKTDSTENNSSSTESKPEGTLTVSLNFTHGNTLASNQYAIWVEDNEGNLIRTIFVTAFTGNGGYERRKDACPTWVSKAHPSDLSETEVDAFTGATPSNGRHSYSWDGKNDKSNHVKAGTYKIFVEGTLYWSSRVLYQGSFNYGGQDQNVTLTPSFSSDDDTNRDMLTQCLILK